jgi:queuine tRNA-ribosyltransferase catalytic subunit
VECGIRTAEFANDHRPIDEHCHCYVCKHYTRSFLHRVAGREVLGSQLLTYHNIAYQKALMNGMRQAIIDGTLPAFVRNFMTAQYPLRNFPRWTVDALAAAGIEL